MTVFRVRLLLDFVAVGLIVACLAYWWLDNLSHEVFGTALFALVIGHNVFNRRWYGKVRTGRRDANRIFNILTIICLAIAMLVMLSTSLLISRDLFSFMALDGAFAVREIHMFAGYWTLLIIAIHLGTRWMVVMNTIRVDLGSFLPERCPHHGSSGGGHGHCDLGREKFPRDGVRLEADADLLPRHVGFQREHAWLLYQLRVDRRVVRRANPLRPQFDQYGQSKEDGRPPDLGKSPLSLMAISGSGLSKQTDGF